MHFACTEGQGYRVVSAKTTTKQGMSQASASDGVTSPAAPFVDSATDCAICLCPLAAEECITLHCGHVWHLRCIKEQLLHAEPNPSRRLLFTGCRCAKCGQICEHPALESVSRSTNELREAVDRLIEDQIKVDALDRDPRVLSPDGHYFGDPLALGRSMYAFFQCSICSAPYFGGTVACADAEDEILPAADRMCPVCAPGTSAVCASNAHTAFHVWKCRYCCNSASFVCYGRTHFCADCHARNSLRKPDDTMTAIECPGRPACQTRLPAGKTHHENGPRHTCEQILRCTLCESDPTGVGARIDSDNASPNMVFNPSAVHGTRGWHPHPSGMWTVETSEVPFRDGEFNFVSSFHWASMSQVIPLSHFLALPGSAALEVSARYMARTDCPSLFCIEAVVYSNCFIELAHFSSEILQAPADFWEPVKHVFAPTGGAAYLVVGVRGKDERFWQGEFGSKVTDISVKVLFDQSTATEEEIVRPEVFVNMAELDFTAGMRFALGRFRRREANFLMYPYM